MKIENLKDLESVLKLCRKQGVTSISIDGIQLALGDLPEQFKKSGLKSEEQENREFSDEDVLFWSSSTIDGN